MEELGKVTKNTDVSLGTIKAETITPLCSHLLRTDTKVGLGRRRMGKKLVHLHDGVGRSSVETLDCQEDKQGGPRTT